MKIYKKNQENSLKIVPVKEFFRYSQLLLKVQGDGILIAIRIVITALVKRGLVDLFLEH